MTGLEAALAWSRGDEIGRACPVAPSRPGSKVPLIEAGANGSGGYNAATVDAERIRSWWERAPDAGLAIHLERAGLVALDVEGPSKGHNARQVVAAIKSTGRTLPRTRVHTTPGGGLHYLFTRAHERPAGAYLTRVPGVAGVEIKRTGVVLVPPSRVDGRLYRVLVEAPLAAAPRWMLAPPAPAAPKRTIDNAKAAQVLTMQADTVRVAAPGAVNDTLCRAAFVVGGLVGAGRLDLEAARAELRAAALAAGHGLTGDRPDPRAEHAMDRTLALALERGAARPWGAEA